MNWSQTKLIFLVAFLILDLFLGYQLYEKRRTDQIPVTDSKLSPTKELANGNIELPSDLPQEKTATYIKGKAVSFVKTSSLQGQNADGASALKDITQKHQQLKPEINQLTLDSSGQIVQHIHTEGGGKVLVSTLVKPYPISGDLPSDEMATFLKTYVYKGTNYELWKQDTAEGQTIITFAQTFHGHPTFSRGKNQRGLLKVFVSGNQITGFQQSYLDLETRKEKNDLVKPIKAVYTLYVNDDFSPGSTVKEVELSYYNLIESLEKVKVFVPTWHIIVEDAQTQSRKEFFVNAIDSRVLTMAKPEKNTKVDGE